MVQLNLAEWCGPVGGHPEITSRQQLYTNQCSEVDIAGQQLVAYYGSEEFEVGGCKSCFTFF